MEKRQAVSIPGKIDEKSRREFLTRAGKMAMYIPPAMMLMMYPNRNALAGSTGCSGGGISRRSGRHRRR